MSMLKPAENKASYAKVGLYGRAGSGKTRTAAEFAIGLYKKIGGTRGVAMFDTEGGSSYIKPMFDAAGVPFFVFDESRSLKDLLSFWEEAEKSVDVIIVDSVTHIWRDVQKSYLDKLNATRAQKGRSKILKLEFHHWGPIKEAWARFTDQFMRSKVHAIVCGRAGEIYEYQQNAESGKMELITVGTKMATEKEMGYEPSLLIEMEHVIDDASKQKIINTAFVVKDRWDIYNGQAIEFPTYDKLKRHFESLNLSGGLIAGEDIAKTNSQEMFDGSDEDGFGAEMRQRTIASEEIAGLMAKYYPSQTVEQKSLRAELMEMFFQTRSWTKVENTDSKKLRTGYIAMKAFLEGEKDVREKQTGEASNQAPGAAEADAHRDNAAGAGRSVRGAVDNAAGAGAGQARGGDAVPAPVASV